ncbi:unnamed protein product [Urochloa decumbens]|uniref:F-box domain-containing protein n=1 Tax=Urochloa decumbens TaxID=240449 RepID=A0ABC9BJG4_9POAL
MADGGTCLPDDVLVQIFLLVPARSRRPLRLVCKGWRDILVFINKGRTSRAVVFDGGSRHRERARAYTSSSDGGRVRMVGTCNGLLCLHDHSTTYAGFSISTITVTNPVTGDTAVLPPVPRRWAWVQLAKAPGHYSFGFHPETKLHKVVYIPRGHRWSLDALQVFTLGSKAWRAPISVAGTTYWLAAGRVMSLDLGQDERVASLDAPLAEMARPAPAALRETARDISWRLTKVGASGEPRRRGRGADGSVHFCETGGCVGAGRGRRGRGAAAVEPEVQRRREHVGLLGHGAAADARGLRPERGARVEIFAFAAEVDDAAPARGGRADGGDDNWQRQLPRTKGAQLIMSKEEREGELTTFAYVETQNPVPRSK